MTNTTTPAATALLDGVTPERLWVSENGKFLVYPEHPVFPTDVPYVRADLYAAALARAEAADARVAELEGAMAKGKPAFRMTWTAAPRPPLHPEPMEGRATFESEESALSFMRNRPSDSKFVSMHKSITIDCGALTPPADLKGGEE